jgi:hypothetical protein
MDSPTTINTYTTHIVVFWDITPYCVETGYPFSRLQEDVNPEDQNVNLHSPHNLMSYIVVIFFRTVLNNLIY